MTMKIPAEIRDRKLQIRDEIIAEDGTLIIPSEKAPKRMIGVLQQINPLTGNPVVNGILEYNDIIIPGSNFVLEKMFNKRSNFGMTTLSYDLGANAVPQPTQDNLKDEFIFGFVLGIGGVESADITRAVRFRDKTVSSIVPFRVVPTSQDLSLTEQAKYAMKKQVGTNYHYYAKRFDTDVVIRNLFTDGTEIPPNIDQTETSMGQLVYAEAILNISSSDLREYFINQFGTVDNCRFNSIGLVAGFNSGGDMAGVRTVTKINTTNMPLSDMDSSFTFAYRVYCI